MCGAAKGEGAARLPTAHEVPLGVRLVVYCGRLILLAADFSWLYRYAHSRCTCFRHSPCSGHPMCPDLIGRRNLCSPPALLSGYSHRQSIPSCSCELAAAPAGAHAQVLALLLFLCQRLPVTALGLPRCTTEETLRGDCLHCAPNDRERLVRGGQTKVFGERDQRETRQSRWMETMVRRQTKWVSQTGGI